MNRTKYKTILADPPWNEVGGGRIKRGADRHYPLMKTHEISAYGGEFQDSIDPGGCHLYMWTTNNHLRDALLVVDSWGFRYVSCITWAKDRMGLGQYFRGKTEQILFCVKGSLPYKTKDGKRQQGTTLIEAPRGAHSAKPVEAYEMIEKVSYAPRLELFARSRREGWTSWGNQLPPLEGLNNVEP